MMNMILAGAQIGTSLLQARQSIGAAGDTLGSNLASLEMKERGLEMQASQQARQRRQQLSDTLAAQQAGLAASGVMGGRTKRMLERDARLRASRERERAGVEQAYQQQALEAERSMAKSQFETSVRQAQVDMLSGVTKGLGTLNRAFEQNPAKEA